jgi:ABC-2 type transport system permease protein
MNSMGATLGDVIFEVRALWALTVFYLVTACIVYGFEMRQTRQHAQERLAHLRKKREVRLQMKAKKS